eukprot:1559348-Rhodomonas_salina.1
MPHVPVQSQGCAQPSSQESSCQVILVLLLLGPLLNGSLIVGRPKAALHREYQFLTFSLYHPTGILNLFLCPT